MKQDAFLKISSDQLKEHDSSTQIDRVWRRIRRDRTEFPRRSRLVGRTGMGGWFWAASWVWVPATVVLAFGSGVFVGKGMKQPDATGVSPERLPQTNAQEAERPKAEPNSLPSSPERRARSLVRRAHPSEHDPLSESLEVPSEPMGVVGVAPTTESVHRTPDWQNAVDQGDYALARKAVDAAGGFDALMDSASAEELMTLVDVARYAGARGAGTSGDVSRAIQGLRIVTERYPDDPNAPLAAMMLGNMLLDVGDRAGASEAFELNRRLSPKGDFAEDALARQFEVSLEQGDLEQAQRLVEQYAKDFPSGRRLEEIRAALDKATADAGAVDPEAPTEPAAPNGSEAEVEPPPN
jgi:TolA-binding protein